MTKPSNTLLAGLAVGAIIGFLGAGWVGPGYPFSAVAAPSSLVSINAVPPILPISAQPLTPAPTQQPVVSPEPENPAAWLRNWVEAGAPPEQEDDALEYVTKWSALDATSALDFVVSAPRFPQRLEALAIPLAILGAANPGFSANWIRSRFEPAERRELATSVARAIGRHNVAMALELALAPDLLVEMHCASLLVSELAQTDPVRAVTCFQRLSEEGRNYAADELAAVLYARDPESAIRWCLAAVPSEHGSNAVKGLIMAAAKQTPEKIPDLMGRLQVAPDLLGSLYWEFGSAEQALALLPFLPPDSRGEAVSRIAAEELPRDPALALQLAGEVLPVDEGRSAIRHAWRNWLESDPLAARDWASSLVDEELKRELLGDPVEQMVRKNPRQFLTEAVGANQNPNNAALIKRAVRNLASSDPVEAAQWLGRLPRDVSLETVSQVTSSWLRRDEAAAWQWIAHQPDVALRDAALASAVQRWSTFEDSSMATAAIEAVSNPQNRTALRWDLARRLHSEDPAAARQWLAAQPLSSEIRDNWVSLLEYSR